MTGIANALKFESKQEARHYWVLQLEKVEEKILPLLKQRQEIKDKLELLKK